MRQFSAYAHGRVITLAVVYRLRYKRVRYTGSYCIATDSVACRRGLHYCSQSTIFIEQWRSTTRHAPAIIGLLVTAVCLALFGSESFLIPAMGMILLLLCLHKDKEEPAHD